MSSNFVNMIFYCAAIIVFTLQIDICLDVLEITGNDIELIIMKLGHTNSMIHGFTTDGGEFKVDVVFIGSL